MKFFTGTIETLLIIALIAIAGLSLASFLPIPGQVQVKIVQSGSMEPNIHTGSIVVIQPAPFYNVGEVVTFGADTKAHAPTTHRIIAERSESGVTYFTTKGDANEEADTSEAPAQDVIGRVLFTVPYVGYLIDFAKQPLGFVLLVVIPAVLIILHELWGIFTELRGPRGPRRAKNHTSRAEVAEQNVPVRRLQNPVQQKESRVMYTRRSLMDDIFVPRVFHTLPITTAMSSAPVRASTHSLAASLLIFASVPAALAFFTIGGTSSYFTSAQHSLANVLSAAGLDFTVDADAPRAVALSIDGVGKEEGTSLVPFVASVQGTLPFAYSIHTEMTGGDGAFCDALQLAGETPPFTYDGPLLALSTATTTNQSPWNFALYLSSDPGVVEGTVCQVDLVYSGEQEGGGGDYSDEERLSLLITYHETAPLLKTFSIPEESVVPEPPLEEPTPDVVTPPTDEPPADTVPTDPLPEEVPPVVDVPEGGTP